MARFGKVLTAMITPFDEAGALDLDAARALRGSGWEGDLEELRTGRTA